jgi:shikimate kinase
MCQEKSQDPSVAPPPDQLIASSLARPFSASQGAGNLYVIGYRGTGKTTVARLLATRLHWPFIDMDDQIEARQGRSIRRVFEECGEAEFRRLESDLLRALNASPPCVIATGGGVILDRANRDFLRTSGTTVWLTADAGTLWQRLQEDHSTMDRRPNLAQGGFVEIEKLLQWREPFYRECADSIVDTTGRSPEDVVSLILAELNPG